VLIFLVFGLYTIIYSVVLSFFRWKGFTKFSLIPPVCEAPGCAFWGLKNYQDFLYRDPGVAKLFWQAMENNAVIAIVVPVGTILIGLLVALALNRTVRGQSVFRTIMMLPMVTSGIAVYYAWSSIFLSNGPLNAFLNTIGLGFLAAKHGWLGGATTALPALMAVMIWSSVPSAVILNLAGLQTIDQDLYEAATIDGANGWQMLWFITWPLLRPITVIILILGINSALQGFELPLLMTRGGPANHTLVVGLRIFNFGFGNDLQLGIASAMGWGLFLLVFLISLLNLRLFRSKVEG
jgi:multiple sugar transport system permease protein/raffinose/stachyose/melibiose transport system permease protein